MSQLLSRQQQVSVAKPFDSSLFGRWMRMLLVSFYNDDEIVVANLLYHRAVMLKDTVLAKMLNLPERQVRQILETRLVPDCIVERTLEGTGERMRTFYRISPTAAAVAAKRLQMLEDSLASKTEECYHCFKCNRVYDSLQAISLTGNKSGSGFSFFCEDCDQELTSGTADDAVKHERLQRFRLQCKDLLLLTKDVEAMAGPQFSHEAKVKQTENVKDPQKTTAMLTASNPASVDPSIQSARQVPDPSTNLWFQQEILGSQDTFSATSAAVSKRLQEPSEASGIDIQQVLDSSQQSRSRVLEERLLRSQASLSEDCKVQIAEEVMVTVQGLPYSLVKVLEDEDLQDKMTDEEYQRFVDADRELQQKRKR